MAEEQMQGKRERWLAAAWPGMGNVGVGAAAYLVNKLDAKLVNEIPGEEVFDVQHVDVKDGLARAGRLPRSMFFEWSDASNPRDLLIFLSEAQPQVRGYAFCQRMLEYAISRGVTQVFTFAAMATQLHPASDPTVYGIATNGEGIRQLQSLDVTLLKEGQITGLNGVLLAAAAERGLPGSCLLGELPYFAAGVPNPKASMAVLEVFTTMAGIEIDFAELREQAEAVERGLLELMEKLQDAAREQSSSDADVEGFAVPEDDEEVAAEEEGSKPQLDAAARHRIESLFEAAQKDRSRAVHLKQELDRLGVFKQYEDRFLDLFKRAE